MKELFPYNTEEAMQSGKIAFGVLVVIVLFFVARRPPSSTRTALADQPGIGPVALEPPSSGSVSEATLSDPPASVPKALPPQKKPSAPQSGRDLWPVVESPPEPMPSDKCDQGQTFYATGSWGRVTNVSSRCWAFPTPDSFAVECDADTLRATGVSFSLELHADLILKELKCVNCKHLPSPAEQAKLVTAKQLQQGGGSVKENEDGRESSQRGPKATLVNTYAVNIGKKACAKGSGTFPHSCVIKIDALVSLGSGVQKPPEVCFVSIGDWGSPTKEMLDVAAMLAKLSKRKLLKFIVSTGDNFYPTGVQTLQDPHWQQTFELPYASQYLQNIRWYMCAGNHDQWGLQSQLVYGEDHPRWYFPKLFYGDSIPLFRHPQCSSSETIEVFVLNSSGKHSDKQIDELEEFFATTSKRVGDRGRMADAPRHWRMIVNHEPMFSGGMHGQSQRNTNLREKFLPVITSNKVHAYFNGDDHFLEIHSANGTDFFVSGAGGGGSRYPTIRLPQTAWMMPSSDVGVRGVMLHCMQGGTMQTSLIDETGSVLHEHRTKFSAPLQRAK